MLRKLSFILILAMLVGLLPGCELKLGELPFELPGQPETNVSEPAAPVVTVPVVVTPETMPPATVATEPTQTIPAEELQWKPFQAYRRVVDRLRAEMGSDWTACSYVLYDINDDGHPELITHRGTITADTYFEVYTMVKDDAVSVGLIGDGLLGGLATHPGLLSIWARQGMEEITIYTLNGTRLEADVIYSDYGKEYHSCQSLTMYGLADETGWNWESNPADNNAALVEQLKSPQTPQQSASSYVIRVAGSEQEVRRQPSWSSEFVQYLPVGNYTIVEESYDGNALWGKLKSGIGWVCLDEILGYRVGDASVVITECDGSGNYQRYDINQGPYTRGITVYFREEVNYLSLCYAPGGTAESEVLQLNGPLKPGSPIAFYVEFPGDLSEYQLWVEDAETGWYTYHIYVSGYDGSIRCYE